MGCGRPLHGLREVDDRIVTTCSVVTTSSIVVVNIHPEVVIW
jgi:hypothetical protein